MKYKKEDFHNVINLYSKQDWLIPKENELSELIDFCESKGKKELIFSLLDRFHYLKNKTLNMILNSIADYIINDTGFNIETSQILAITYDDEADSSQKILDMIKMPLYQKGWRNFKTVNHYSSSIKNYKKGRFQIIVIDEFIGSGKTIRGRLKQLKNDIQGDFEIKYCFIAGIKNTVDKLQKEGFDIFCPLLLDRGISDFYIGEGLESANSIMLELETKLAPSINGKKIEDYSFGYGKAEALYSLEGCSGNTPNSVFPIFWWIRDKNEKERKTLLTRFEPGF